MRSRRDPASARAGRALKHVAKPHDRDLRANQKQRTRAAIVEAASRLLREGGAPPSVAQAAEAARVSRATAYRYFPTPDSLLLEVAAVTPAVAPVEQVLASLDTGDVAQRLARLQDAFHRVALAEEVQMRTALRAYLDAWLAGQRAGGTAAPVREGRRMRWLDTVLEPVRGQLPAKSLRRLKAALALTLGMDAIVVLKDVCRLRDAEALDVLTWAARALLQAGLDEERAAGRRTTRSATTSATARRGAAAVK